MFLEELIASSFLDLISKQARAGESSETVQVINTTKTWNVTVP